MSTAPSCTTRTIQINLIYIGSLQRMTAISNLVSGPVTMKVLPLRGAHSLWFAEQRAGGERIPMSSRGPRAAANGSARRMR